MWGVRVAETSTPESDLWWGALSAPTSLDGAPKTPLDSPQAGLEVAHNHNCLVSLSPPLPSCLGSFPGLVWPPAHPVTAAD